MSILKARSWFRFAVVLLVVPWIASCATITRGTTEAFVVSTSPPGADVALSNGLSCSTPCSVEVKRKTGFTVRIEKDGYESIETAIVTQVAGAGAAGMAGNVFVGGLIGLAVDAGTGAMNELKPNPLHVNLLALEEDAAPAEVLPRRSARTPPARPLQPARQTSSKELRPPISASPRTAFPEASPDRTNVAAQSDRVQDAECSIKGNLEADGTRLYYLSNHRWYDLTSVNPARGEQWFCSEAEAGASGWRKAAE